MLTDSEEIREILTATYPGFEITGLAAASGQRVVYFGTFKDFKRQEAEELKQYNWKQWNETAIKVSSASSAASIARIQSEIDALNSINSNYYPTLYHSEILSFHPETEDKLDPKLFVTIEEKIDSTPLSDCMEDFSSEKAVVTVLIHLIEALKILWDHDKRYVHRDIKPENILIKPNGQLVVIDLGIIRETGQQGITMTGVLNGPCTPTYASPEQLNNDKENINYKSDLFSLGVLAYTLLAQENPFYSEGDELDDIAQKVLGYDPLPLYEKRACSKTCSDIIVKLMSKAPFRRFRKVDELLNNLTELLE